MYGSCTVAGALYLVAPYNRGDYRDYANDTRGTPNANSNIFRQTRRLGSDVSLAARTPESLTD